MPTESVKPDRIWSLAPEHEIVLKQTWAIILKHFGYDLDNLSFHDLELKSNFVASKSKNALPIIPKTSDPGDVPEPSKRTVETYHSLSGKTADELTGEFDKSANAVSKEHYHHFSKFDDVEMHQAFFSSVRNDSPDNDLLRFVRARKFKVHHIVEMAAKCWEWRATTHNVNKWFFEGDAQVFFSGKKPEFIKAFELEKAYMRGEDYSGGPVAVIRVKKHFGHDCPEKDFERFICVFIEWSRLRMRNYEIGNDGANILFDMTGFSLKNADMNAVKFLVKQFEANYPESLNAIWVHKAPWIFNAVWKIIKGWLDPVVASKIHFTKSAQDLEKFLDKKYIPKNLGGSDSYEPKYVPPTKENSSTRPKDDTYVKLMEQRKKLMLSFIETTILWIQAKTTEESTKYLDSKIDLGAKLGLNYKALDPYVRYRGAFDRDGSLGEIGI